MPRVGVCVSPSHCAPSRGQPLWGTGCCSLVQFGPGGLGELRRPRACLGLSERTSRAGRHTRNPLGTLQEKDAGTSQIPCVLGTILHCLTSSPFSPGQPVLGLSCHCAHWKAGSRYGKPRAAPSPGPPPNTPVLWKCQTLLMLAHRWAEAGDTPSRWWTCLSPRRCLCRPPMWGEPASPVRAGLGLPGQPRFPC